MSSIHAEMSAWRRHLRNCREKEKLCISCGISKLVDKHLCYDCRLTESEWSEGENMNWKLGTYINQITKDRAIIVHQRDRTYFLRYLDQQKIETISEIDFLMNWKHEDGEEE